MQKYFDKAIELAKLGVKNLEGGPFGAVVVKDNKIIGYGNIPLVNLVLCAYQQLFGLILKEFILQLIEKKLQKLDFEMI